VRIGIASILQESNTFSPVFTKYEDFTPVFGQAVLERHTGKLTEMGGFLRVLADARATVVPICAAWAITANRLLRSDFTKLADRVEQELAKAEIDALLFAMHGAQTAEGADDVEGALLGRARARLGPDKPVGVTLDLHANITAAMVHHATFLVGYHTYPHVDMYETGQKAASILLRTLRGEIKPVMAYRKLPLIIPPENSSTHHGPMSRLIRSAQAREEAGQALSLSIFPVQPWLDIEEMGCATVAVVDGNRGKAQKYADELAAKLWRRKEQFAVQLTPPAEAISSALRIKGGPVILSESSDSTGSGSPGDSTGVLKHLIDAPLDGPAAIFLVDPESVDAAFRAGVGATIQRRMGGAFDKKHSKPVKVKGYVKLLADGRWTARARGYNTGTTTSMGRAAVIEAGHVKILLAERSAMTVDPELFRSHGIDPLYCKIVVVKSPAGFRSEYEPIAKKIFLVDTPGVSTAKFETLPYKRIPRPMYPFDRGTAMPQGLPSQ
jgi:microcystin degradation protein MlrC